MSGLVAGFEAAAVAVLGLILGSFLNVVIHRLPRRESVVTPRSRCPACGKLIPWYENLPLLSYLTLRGRCSGCATTIPLRYFLVEAATAGALVLLWLRFGVSSSFLCLVPFTLAMVALFAIDLEHQLLPDAITWPGVALGLAVSPWNRPLRESALLADILQLWLRPDQRIPPALRSPLEALLGALLGYGLLWGLAWGYERARGVEGLGGGDIKLAAMIGAWGGPRAVIAVLLLASLAGVALGLALVALKRADMQTPLPFGCFLTAAAFLVVLLGTESLWLGWQGWLGRWLYGFE